MMDNVYQIKTVSKIKKKLELNKAYILYYIERVCILGGLERRPLCPTPRIGLADGPYVCVGIV